MTLNRSLSLAAVRSVTLNSGLGLSVPLADVTDRPSPREYKRISVSVFCGAFEALTLRLPKEQLPPGDAAHEANNRISGNASPSSKL